MAHIGRLYPVAFRRDFNLNAPTNNLGWANRYIGGIRMFAAGIGAVLNGVDFDAGPSFQSQPDEIDWASEFKRLGLFFYKMELLVQIPDGTHFLRQVSFNASGHGTILVCNWPIEDSRGRLPGWPFNQDLNVVFWSTDWFDGEPKSVQATIAPKVWSLPPPH